MEKLKEKHNHKLTDLLKVAMFSLVMLAPFLAIGVRCGYVMWNKNAKDSYFGETINNEQTENTTITYATQNVKYTTNTNNIEKPFTEGYKTNIIVRDLYINNVNYSTYNQISFSRESSGQYRYIIAVSGENVNTIYLNYTNDNYLISFYYISTLFNQVDIPLEYTSYNKYSYLDNAFSYSVSQISNDPIFNWTRNTGIYQPINAMVSGLEIENDTLQILLAYWSLMTAVYIVFDLIIFCFTKLTHFING